VIFSAQAYNFASRDAGLQMVPKCFGKIPRMWSACGILSVQVRTGFVEIRSVFRVVVLVRMRAACAPIIMFVSSDVFTDRWWLDPWRWPKEQGRAWSCDTVVDDVSHLLWSQSGRNGALKCGLVSPSLHKQPGTIQHQYKWLPDTLTAKSKRIPRRRDTETTLHRRTRATGKNRKIYGEIWGGLAPG
jgi:hypothetical protein